MIKTLWHPEDPGMKVPVRFHWWTIRGEFATFGDVMRYYKSKELVRCL